MKVPVRILLLLCLTSGFGEAETTPVHPSPKQVLERMCKDDAFAKSWIAPKRGIKVIQRDGAEETQPGFQILESSLLSYVEGTHTIACPATFSGSQITCRKSAGGEAYRYIFEKHPRHYILTTIEIEYEE